MNLKTNLNHHKIFLVLSQICVLFLAMAILFWLMVAGNKERIENDLKTKLDASTQAMAAQLKSNQVPFSAGSVQPSGVFIINQTDGSIVIDRRNEGDNEQKLWEEYKTKIIYEMQKQKRGWIEYPDKSTWLLNGPKRIIRYISIDELNWILAVEDLKPSSLDLFKASVNPSTCFMILFLFILGAGALWLINVQYFDLIKRHISNSLEDNLLSMSGEEKLWGKSQGAIPNPKAPTSQPLAVEDPIMEEIFHKPPAQKPISLAQHEIVLPAKEMPKEAPKDVPKEPPVRTVENNDMVVDVQHIHSPVLKKILKKFREK